MTLIVCEFDICHKHGTKMHGYPCHDCQEEWRTNHPLSVQAIKDMVDNKISLEHAQRILKEERVRA